MLRQTSFHLTDLHANNIIHNFTMPSSNCCSIAITPTNSLPIDAQAFHRELWQQRYIRRYDIYLCLIDQFIIM